MYTHRHTANPTCMSWLWRPTGRVVVHLVVLGMPALLQPVAAHMTLLYHYASTCFVCVCMCVYVCVCIARCGENMGTMLTVDCNVDRWPLIVDWVLNVHISLMKHHHHSCTIHVLTSTHTPTTRHTTHMHVLQPPHTWKTNMYPA